MSRTCHSAVKFSQSSPWSRKSHLMSNPFGKILNCKVFFIAAPSRCLLTAKPFSRTQQRAVSSEQLLPTTLNHARSMPDNKNNNNKASSSRYGRVKNAQCFAWQLQHLSHMICAISGRAIRAGKDWVWAWLNRSSTWAECVLYRRAYTPKAKGFTELCVACFCAQRLKGKV